VTSQRKRKKVAASLGLSERELLLAELLDEILEHVRWLSILGYGNQYLLRERLEIGEDERRRVLEAATRAVDRDARMHEWRERLARIKGEAARADRAMEGEIGAPDDRGST
jgi:hypothetical protein